MPLHFCFAAAFNDSIIGEAELVRYLLAQLVMVKHSLRPKPSSSSIVLTVKKFVGTLGVDDLVEEVGRGEEEAGRTHVTASKDSLDSLLSELGLGHIQSISQREVCIHQSSTCASIL
jgi:hypothetical protein